MPWRQGVLAPAFDTARTGGRRAPALPNGACALSPNSCAQNAETRSHSSLARRLAGLPLSRRSARSPPALRCTRLRYRTRTAASAHDAIAGRLQSLVARPCGGSASPQPTHRTTHPSPAIETQLWPCLLKAAVLLGYVCNTGLCLHRQAFHPLAACVCRVGSGDTILPLTCRRQAINATCNKLFKHHAWPIYIRKRPITLLFLRLSSYVHE